MVKGAESPEGGESLREEITNEEMKQIQILATLDSISDMCHKKSTCFVCPFRMYELDQVNRPELLYRAQVKHICALYPIFNCKPDEISRFRLLRLIEEGRSTDVLEKKAGDTGRG